MTANKGQWVQVHNIILKPSERAAQAPEDTRAVPLEMWVKGYLTEDTELGAECLVITPTGREVRGTLEELEPGYVHGYGGYVPELDIVRWQVRDLLNAAPGEGAGK